MEYFNDLTRLARWIGISRMHLYRLIKKCPPPDKWYNEYVHKGRKKNKDSYWPYDKIQVITQGDVKEWLKVVCSRVRMRYDTRMKIDRLSKL